MADEVRLITHWTDPEVVVAVVASVVGLVAAVASWRAATQAKIAAQITQKAFQAEEERRRSAQLIFTVKTRDGLGGTMFTLVMTNRGAAEAAAIRIEITNTEIWKFRTSGDVPGVEAWDLATLPPGLAYDFPLKRQADQLADIRFTVTWSDGFAVNRTLPGTVSA